ncbi:MAG: DEAD/DEAH box helicase family protein [Alphaproteobacteria bacterium]|nr:DEAD/DEAH box helicase family protein [Alphaproteobacteria bacterium]
MAAINIKTAKQIEPKCYAYTTPEIKRHDGWTKIGYTEQDDVKKRIQQQTQTANVEFNLEWEKRAIYEDGTGDAFRDKDFHAYLSKKDYEKMPNTEWFHILPNKSLEEFLYFRSHRGILESYGALPYQLRQEQNQAVQQTKNYFTLHTGDEPEFLWNAKPRFGKTLSTYELCKTLDARKILIVTNRPAIATSWYDDYVKFLGTQSGYYFISQVDTLKERKYVLSREQYVSVRDKLKGFIEFVSLQDMKGSIYFGGNIDKLKEVAELEWDILVIDEAHEGVDTYKTDVAFDHIKRKYTLHLSGTPFKALANSKFREEEIYNWTYADEQKAKREWDSSSEEENPYATLPQLNLYTYQMSEIIRDKLKKGADFDNDGEDEEYAFDLNEFFATQANGSFKYDADVDKFLEALTTLPKFPFSTDELRQELKHTFWLLNRVDSAKALARKLKEHPVFADYEIVLVAGDGRLDDDTENKKAFDKVIKAIKENEKTITISVGQLTTGVTVPEWTAVLMLSNVKSPALYMQAAFRAQNPCLFNIDGSLFRKENAYVFDFDPARTLDIFEQFANDLSADTTSGKGDMDTRKRHVRELINFFPVYGEDDEGEMITLDAEKVLSIPRKIHAVEVVRRGFMSNFLFQNISNIFSAPKEVVDIIKQFEPVKEPVPVTKNTKDDLSINDDGEVELSQKTIDIGVDNVFGEKIYAVVDDLQDTIEEIQKKPTDIKKDTTFEALKEQFKATVAEPLISTAKEHYGKDMSASTQKAVERKINAESDTVIAKHYGDFKIQHNTIELERQKEIEQARIEHKPEKIAQINKVYDKKQEENKKSFVESMQEKAEELVKTAGQTIVEAVETDKKTKEKNAIETSVRDHLRGFSRTIPSFLMAYGDDDTTLENFDEIIPDEVFKDVTSISLDEFRFLRDGGDYTDEETGETKHFDGHLFDPVVFNDSVKEFLRLKRKLANYFDENSTEDIFDYIPPQKTNQIYTPKKVVIEMVDNLEKECPECFEDSDKTFIDLYMKSGLYITEIVKRLFRSKALKREFPNENDRLKHIFANQVYGLAPTEIIYRIAKAYILGFDEDIEIKKHHLRQFDTLPSVQRGTLERDLDRVFDDVG